MLEVLKISFCKFSKSSLLSQDWRGQAELSHVVPGLAATSGTAGMIHGDNTWGHGSSTARGWWLWEKGWLWETETDCDGGQVQRMQICRKLHTT